MYIRQYKDPSEAYRFMNSWTLMQVSYETQFAGRDVTMVEIAFKDSKPKFASVHYRSGIHTGVDFIDLSKKVILDEPRKHTLDTRLIA